MIEILLQVRYQYALWFTKLPVISLFVIICELSDMIEILLQVRYQYALWFTKLPVISLFVIICENLFVIQLVKVTRVLNSPSLLNYLSTQPTPMPV